MSARRAAHGYLRTDLAGGDAVRAVTLIEEAADEEDFVLAFTFKDADAGAALKIVQAALDNPSVAALVVSSTEQPALVADPRQPSNQHAAPEQGDGQFPAARSMWLTANPDDWGALAAAGKRITQKVKVVAVSAVEELVARPTQSNC